MKVLCIKTPITNIVIAALTLRARMFHRPLNAHRIGCGLTGDETHSLLSLCLMSWVPTHNAKVIRTASPSHPKLVESLHRTRSPLPDVFLFPCLYLTQWRGDHPPPRKVSPQLFVTIHKQSHVAIPFGKSLHGGGLATPSQGLVAPTQFPLAEDRSSRITA